MRACRLAPERSARRSESPWKKSALGKRSGLRRDPAIKKALPVEDRQGLQLFPIDDPVDRCQLRPARVLDENRPVGAPACRVVTSIYTLRLKRWRRGAGCSLHGPRVSSRAVRLGQPRQVRDCRYPCPRRFPRFLVFSSSPPVVRSPHHLGFGCWPCIPPSTAPPPQNLFRIKRLKR